VCSTSHFYWFWPTMKVLRLGFSSENVSRGSFSWASVSFRMMQVLASCAFVSRYLEYFINITCKGHVAQTVLCLSFFGRRLSKILEKMNSVWKISSRRCHGEGPDQLLQNLTQSQLSFTSRKISTSVSNIQSLSRRFWESLGLCLEV